MTGPRIEDILQFPSVDDWWYETVWVKALPKMALELIALGSIFIGLLVMKNWIGSVLCIGLLIQRYYTYKHSLTLSFTQGKLLEKGIDETLLGTH
jgi:hypothetical protein